MRQYAFDFSAVLGVKRHLLCELRVYFNQHRLDCRKTNRECVGEFYLVDQAGKRETGFKGCIFVCLVRKTGVKIFNFFNF